MKPSSLYVTCVPSRWVILATALPTPKVTPGNLSMVYVVFYTNKQSCYSQKTMTRNPIPELILTLSISRYSCRVGTQSFTMFSTSDASPDRWSPVL